MSSRNKILARRARFVAAAMTGMGVIGCASKSEACLSMVAEDAGPDGTRDTSAADSEQPEACLSAPFDSGSGDTGRGDTPGDVTTTDSADTGPMPCLAPPPGDSG